MSAPFPISSPIRLHLWLNPLFPQQVPLLLSCLLFLCDPQSQIRSPYKAE